MNGGALNPHWLDEARESALARGVVIVGAGQAGGRAAESLRANGFIGRITLIGDEEEFPYERPSLSKEMLCAGDDEVVAWVQQPEFYATQNIDLLIGTRATAVDRTMRTVQLANGDAVEYGALIFASGARARRLPLVGSEPHCHYLRTLEDSRALRSKLTEGARVVIVGAGFIGLEVAAAAVKLGCTVTVIETGLLPLGRVLPQEIGAYYKALHQGRGVKFMFGIGVERLRRHGEGMVLETTAHDIIAADVLIVGIGVIPNAELASVAGLEVERGIAVDEFGKTADPFIFAAGDVAWHYNPLYGRHVLLESWQNAQNQAIAIARNLASMTAPVPYAEVPWFWSDQYDVNLQMFGISESGAETVIRGDKTQKSWILFQIKDGKMICAIGLNAARELRAARDLITMGVKVVTDELVDTSKPLIELVRREKREQAPANATIQYFS